MARIDASNFRNLQLELRSLDYSMREFRGRYPSDRYRRDCAPRHVRNTSTRTVAMCGAANACSTLTCHCQPGDRPVPGHDCVRHEGPRPSSPAG